MSADATPAGLDDAVAILVGRLSALPDGSVVAMTLFGPGERTVTALVGDGTATVVPASQHRPGAVLSFHSTAAIDAARDPSSVQRLHEAGRLHRRGNAELAKAAVDALSQI